MRSHAPSLVLWLAEARRAGLNDGLSPAADAKLAMHALQMPLTGAEFQHHFACDLSI